MQRQPLVHTSGRFGHLNTSATTRDGRQYLSGYKIGVAQPAEQPLPAPQGQRQPNTYIRSSDRLLRTDSDELFAITGGLSSQGLGDGWNGRNMMTRTTLAAVAAAALAGSITHAAELQGTLHALRHISLDELKRQASRPPAPQIVDPLAIYSNVTNVAPLGLFPQGGATPVGSGAFITRMWMDDLQFTTNPGVGLVTTIRFAVYNINATPVTARALLRFWLADGSLWGSLPGPGTYYAPATPGGPVGITFSPFGYLPGATLVTATVPGGGFSVPAGATTRLWAGIAFDSEDGAGGNTGATQAQMNNISQTFFGAPDLGASVDLLFMPDTAGSFLGVDNPTGSAFSLGGNPLANTGWELVVTTLPVELQGFAIQ